MHNLLERNIPFHCPVSHVIVTDSLTRCHMSTPIPFTWFGVLRIFVGLTMWLSLQILHMILVGVASGTFFFGLHCVQMCMDKPPFMLKWHGSPTGCLRCWIHVGLPWQVKSCLELFSDFSNCQNHLGLTTAVDSSSGLTSLMEVVLTLQLEEAIWDSYSYWELRDP